MTKDMRVFCLLALLPASAGVSGCATVRPEQRAVLADPVMQFRPRPGAGRAPARSREPRRFVRRRLGQGRGLLAATDGLAAIVQARRFRRALSAWLALVCRGVRAPRAAAGARPGREAGAAEHRVPRAVAHEQDDRAVAGGGPVRLALEFLAVDAGYEADVVSGASESVKAGRDAPGRGVLHPRGTSATCSTAASPSRARTPTWRGYSYGTEHDYRSNAITVAPAPTSCRRTPRSSCPTGTGSTRCATSPTSPRCRRRRARSSTAPTAASPGARTARRCRSSSTTRRRWTQSWTPVFETQLCSRRDQHGFLSNPYRAVVISAGGETAQEHHPDNRAAAALSLRAKYYASR